VVAGVRSERDADVVTALSPQRISSVILDVTDAGHIAKLEASLPERLDAVVNNAGVVVSGPMETVSPEDWREQLEINVIGQLAVTQAVLPRLRKSRGRVVFISSVNGQLSMPLVGAYCASKFALEAAADALRMELRPWHIGVAIVEPAQTDTDMWRTADDMVDQAEAKLTAEQRDLYAKQIAGFKKRIPLSQKLAVPAEKVSAVVEEALTARRPRARYVVGVGPKLQVALMTNLPTRMRDLVLRKISGQP
jgi:NAD(P)-dependent dehydrogenase (short-subunit alcohol dehydrogenase family)